MTDSQFTVACLFLGALVANTYGVKDRLDQQVEALRRQTEAFERQAAALEGLEECTPCGGEGGEAQ